MTGPLVTRSTGRGGKVAVRLGWGLAAIVVACRVTAWAVRSAWQSRTELGVLIAGVLVYAVGVRTGGPALGRVAVVGLSAGLASAPSTRMAILEALAGSQCRRRLRRGCKALGLVDEETDRPGRIWSTRRVPVGTEMILASPPGVSGEKIEKARPELRAALRCRDLRVAINPGRADRVRLTVVRRESLAARQILSALPAVATAVMTEQVPGLSMWDPVDLGLDEDLNPVRRVLVGRNLLLGGEPGAGKSVALQQVLGHAALSPDVRVIGLDAKTVELAPYRAVCSEIVGANVPDAIDVLGLLQAEMDLSYQRLADLGWMKVRQGDPLTLVACDELALYTSVYGHQKEREEFSRRFRDVVARGRAAGVITVLATQRPSSDIIPTSLRDLVGWRMALRCNTPAASDTVLGDGWHSRGVSATDVPSHDDCRGIGWFISEEGHPVRIRAGWLAEEDLPMIARAGALLRRSGGELRAVA